MPVSFIDRQHAMYFFLWEALFSLTTILHNLSMFLFSASTEYDHHHHENS